MTRPLVIFYYLPTSAYALNVLLGALERFDLDLKVEIRVAKRLAELHDALSAPEADGRRTVVFWSFFSAAFPIAQEHLSETVERYHSPSISHVAGGVHASAEPRQTLQAGFDYVAVGEGEEIVVGIVRCLLEDGDIGGIPGMNQIVDGILTSSEPAGRINLNDFPPFAVRNKRYNPIEITRGCIYACKFCQTPFMFKAKFRHRSVENVVHYVELMRAAGMTDVRFITPTSLSYGSEDASVNLSEVGRLLAGVRSCLGSNGKIFFGSFPSEIRPEHASPEAFDVLKKYVDNDNIIIGAQSGSERVLENSKRGHGTAVIEQAVRYAVEAGFTPNVDFLFGLPGETERDAEESIAFATRLADLGARIHGHTFMPLPGTPFKDEPAGAISDKIKLSLERLTSRGSLYGKWRQQIGIAEQMYGQQAMAKAARKDEAAARRRKGRGGEV